MSSTPHLSIILHPSNHCSTLRHLFKTLHLDELVVLPLQRQQLKVRTALDHTSSVKDVDDISFLDRR